MCTTSIIHCTSIFFVTTHFVIPHLCRDLGEHGFLVEGNLVTTKANAEAVSIPYKYVVYKSKKEKYEYEYIYKLDSTHPTNRCLFVNSHLLNSEGELSLSSHFMHCIM